MGFRKLWFLWLPVGSFLLVSCGGKLTISPSSLSSPYAALEGNWRLTGQSSSWSKAGPDPYIGGVLKVDGDTVKARLNVGVKCSQGTGSLGASVSAAVFATATIEPDGSFALTSGSPSSNFVLTGPVQVKITGTVPPKGSSSWQGSYQIALSMVSSSCYSGSGTFTAVPYAPFEGTYTGTIQQSSLGSSVSVALQVSQLSPELTYLGPAAIPQVSIPLKANIAVSGSPCFTAGSNANIFGGGLFGDEFNLLLRMDDGSNLTLNGWFADPTEAALQPVMLLVKGGKCDGAFSSATLLRQP